MKTFLIEIFIINFAQSNQKIWLLLKKKRSILEEHAPQTIHRMLQRHLGKLL